MKATKQKWDVTVGPEHLTGTSSWTDGKTFIKFCVGEIKFIIKQVGNA